MAAHTGRHVCRSHYQEADVFFLTRLLLHTLNKRVESVVGVLNKDRLGSRLGDVCKGQSLSQPHHLV